jgi:hypothetical protein
MLIDRISVKAQAREGLGVTGTTAAFGYTCNYARASRVSSNQDGSRDPSVSPKLLRKPGGVWVTPRFTHDPQTRPCRRHSTHFCRNSTQLAVTLHRPSGATPNP